MPDTTYHNQLEDRMMNKYFEKWTKHEFILLKKKKVTGRINKVRLNPILKLSKWSRSYPYSRHYALFFSLIVTFLIGMFMYDVNR